MNINNNDKSVGVPLHKIDIRPKTIYNSLHDKLTQAFQPSYLEVINESAQHHVPINSETHFKIIIASPNFSGLSLVKRHQAIYALVQDEMDRGLHALSLHTFSTEEWQKKQHEQIPDTPSCRGGKKDKESE